MGLRKPIRITIGAMNRESLDSLDSLQIDETIERHTRGACRKAQHLCPLFTIE